MADPKKTDAEVAPPPPKAKSKLILFIVIGAVCLALGGGGAFLMLKKQASAAAEDAAGETGIDAAKKKKIDHSVPPAYYKFDKPFTVKLQTEQQEAYLQTEVQLKLPDVHGVDLIKQYEPELKHRITLIMMGKRASVIGTAEGVQRLANELRDVANSVIAPSSMKEKPAGETEPAATADADSPVQSVLFSTFIIQ